MLMMINYFLKCLTDKSEFNFISLTETSEVGLKTVLNRGSESLKQFSSDIHSTVTIDTLTVNYETGNCITITVLRLFANQLCTLVFLMKVLYLIM